MINKAKNITKKDAIKMFKMYRKITKLEVAARIGKIGFPVSADFSMQKIELENRLREFLFGSFNLVELATKWNIPMVEGQLKERRPKKRKKK